MAVGGSVGLTRGFKTGAAVTKNRAVKLSALETVIPVAASTDVSIGIAQDTVSSGDSTRGKGVDVQMSGIAVCEAGASFSLGVEVMFDTSGKVILAATTSNRAVGVALKASTGAADQVPVMLSLPGRVL
jgi:predicted RecA/RadA family phage recombinase